MSIIITTTIIVPTAVSGATMTGATIVIANYYGGYHTVLSWRTIIMAL